MAKKTQIEETFSTAPPKHLSPDSKAWFKRTLAEYDCDEHHVKLLTLACEAWDRGVQAREILAKDGLSFLDRHGSIKPHPAVTIEKDSRIAFARLVRELSLDCAANPESRPPAIAGRYVK